MNRPLLAFVALTSLAGCTGSGTTTPPSNAGPQQVSSGPLRGSPGQGVNGQAAGKPALPPQNIPSGARYAIACAQFGGSDHIEQSRLAKEQLITQSGRPDFHVRHEEDYTQLYYGYYRERDRNVDAKEAARVDGDIGWLRTLKSGVGSQLFPKPLVLELPTDDPSGPPEYDLSRLDVDKDPKDPTRKFWTVVIAAYTSDVQGRDGRSLDRKTAAVEAVKEARALGVKDAYYYHGPSVSQICIGAWPRSALKEQEMDKAESRDEFRANSGEALVVSPAPLPQKFAEKIEAQGNMRVFQPKIEILDPSLQRTLDEYKEYAVNEVIQPVTTTDPKTGKRSTKIQPSFLTQIPRVARSILNSGPAAPQPGGEPGPSVISPLNPNRTTTGGLRGAER